MQDVLTTCQRRGQRNRSRHFWTASSVVLVTLELQPALAANEINLTAPFVMIYDQQRLPAEVVGRARAQSEWFLLSDWPDQAARARASQPSWSSPLVTTTGLLENRLRFDVDMLHAGNGTSTTVLDGGRGLDLIVSDSSEIQLAAALYNIRTSRAGKGALTGFNDWPFLRLEQRLASSPESGDDYVVTAWLQIQAPAGIKTLTRAEPHKIHHTIAATRQTEARKFRASLS